ncbi:transporter substrate-binding domain-containing protein [Pseudoalteromonas shioyasakiensis]|uniref:substrate-binding periplasmic protein n=1 Tax=Pseudoalteromonas TaxID=53246 RepID=UPI0010210476|nr:MULTISPECIES: transporter substrate-binding domain-containing protein [Pseudoalteromonas]MCG9708732.1 transporter substrate-binding domain-containing protein [Pseudoalteromonas sp. Isolate3]MCQ8881562.1 transporter substrate-binding domain-containing protein [Pseudoalteromonas shioyasakiensis]NIZ04783.1 amino acid ABC transporter substrate-binding protein [Pseudoalteromonas sp. HF66]QLE09259.1 transporter substrate-binding domain-containing protein [Pseudoalteromonas shioyasakiensis]QWV0580
MKLLTVFLLFASFQAFAGLTAVSFQKNGEIATEEAVRFNGGYGYNLDANHVLKLVTLDWPPYIDENLCNKGWLFQFTVGSLLEKGYGVHISFYPWARAVREAELGRADILFPEYFIEDNVVSDNFLNKTRNDLLALSHAIPGGDLSFVALKGNQIPFNGDLNSVKDLPIGVVRSYKNTKELDAMIDNKEIDTIVANNEYQLIHLLLSNRVSLIVADLEVLKASIYKSELSMNGKQQMLESLVALEPKLEYKPLYYSVSKSTPHWQKVLKDLNDEIELMQASGKFDEFIQGMKQQCYANDKAA